MTKIDVELISKLEELSGIYLSNEERDMISNDIRDIINMFDTLQEVDTSNIQPLRHMSVGQSRLRLDRIEDQLTNHQALQNAPMKHKGFIAVPKFLK